MSDKQCGDAEMSFINNSGLIFSDISSEAYRQYRFADDSIVYIDDPLKLNVSDSGGHRIFDAGGVSHYIPSGWIHLSWRARDGHPNFVK